MEEIFEKFNATMDKYNDEYTMAENDKDREAIDKKYESIIDKAEEELEKSLEESIEKSNAELEAEQKASEDELKKLEESAQGEEVNEYLVLSTEELQKKYKVADHKAYAETIGLKVSGKEVDIIEQIKDYLNS